MGIKDIASRIFDPLGVHRAFENKGGPKYNLSRWSGGWSIQTADAAYQLILSAGQENKEAKGQLDMIKSAAAKGDPTAMKIMTYFGPIAKMVALNTGPPSTLAAKTLQKRQQKAVLSAKAKQASVMKQTAMRQAQQIKKQQEQLKTMRAAQIQRAKQESFHAKVQQRFAAEQAKFDAEAMALEDKAAALEKQLERRDISDAMREQLEGQAEAYEAEIERIKAEKAGQPEPALNITESIPSTIEGEASMMGEDYPTGAQGGAPGDVEFTEA